MGNPNVAARFGSGQSVARTEDRALLTGTGRYTDDFQPAGTQALVFLRSPHAHARIVSIDTAGAEAMDGVTAVYTGAGMQATGVKPLPAIGAPWKRGDGQGASSPDRWPLALERVYFNGQPVCAVVATTEAQALQAIESIDVQYEALQAITSIDAALADDAPLLVTDAPDNICAEIKHGSADTAEQHFKDAAHVVSIDLVNQRLAPSTLEPRSVLSYLDKDSRLCVQMSSQMPTAMRDSLANAVLQMDAKDIRVMVGDVGGGFGMKTGIYLEDAVVAYAARQTGKPVKWISTRGEELLSATHGRDLLTRAELALDENGQILAYRNRSDADIGGMANPTGVAIQLMIGPWVATSVYHIPVIDFHFRAVLTNKSPTGAYRGAGRPEAIYTIERLMDEAARVMDIEPAEIRRRNLITPAQMPYTNAMQQTYDTGNFELMLDQGLELADWNNFAKRHQQSAAHGKLRGRGLATFLEWTGGTVFEENVIIDVKADGFVEASTALLPMGQGISTCFAQIVAEELKVPFDKVIVKHGDTDRLNGFGSAGSRSIFTGGSALQVASHRLIEKTKALAADHFECAETDVVFEEASIDEANEEARFSVAGTDISIGWFELAAKQPGGQIDINSVSSVDGSTWPNGCHSCEVEIDPDTGKVEVVRYDNVNDVGNVVNPMIVTGQLEGGAMQGIGQALCEEVVYDSDSGQLQTGSLMDYNLPRADDTCFCQTVIDQSIPCKNNPLGLKGVGELGTIGATPAVANAVVDALLRHGVSREKAMALQMPMTSLKVWQVLHGS